MSDFIICSHCNGYGSSMKDPVGVDTCTKCNGKGIILLENKTESTRRIHDQVRKASEVPGKEV